MLAPRRFFAELEDFSDDLEPSPDASREPNLVKLIPHRYTLPNSYIAYPFANIIYPSDWRFVGPRPVIVVNCTRVPPRLILRIYTVTEFERGTGRVVCTVRLKQTNADMAYVGKPNRDLNDGKYVVSLEDAKSKKTLHVTGIQVKRNMDWERRFLQESDDRIQSPVFSTKVGKAPLFSITTTVYNTAPGLLEELFDAVRSQRFDDFEWLLLDNASQRSETIQTMDGLARSDSRVRLFRVGKNLKIIGGNRYLLHLARGRYVVPIDSDDLIYPDSLEALARYCDSPNPPVILYSDEQKVAPDGTPFELIWRTQWSRLLASATVPAAHLTAFSRERALATDVYGGDYAEGCHDWDTVLRLVDSGAKPIHLSDVLYGWRIHSGSAAGEETSKAYILSSQKATLEASLHRRHLGEKFHVLPAKAESPPGYFHSVRRHASGPSIDLDFLLRGQDQRDLANLTHNLQNIGYPIKKIRILHNVDLVDSSGVKEAVDDTVRDTPELRFESFASEQEVARLVSDVSPGTDYKAIVDSGLYLNQKDWLWDAVGSTELDPDCGIVGGTILTPDHRILHIGYVAGFENFFATPHYMETREASLGFAAAIRRNVVAVYGGMMLIRANVLTQIGGPIQIDENDGIFGIEFCLRCREKGLLSGVTPRFQALRRKPLPKSVGAGTELRRDLSRRYRALLEIDPYYSKHLAQSSSKYGELKQS